MKKNNMYGFMSLLGAIMMLQGTAFAERSYGEVDACCWEPTCYENTSSRFFIRGDWLYWRPHVSGLELASGTTFISDTMIDDVHVIFSKESDADPHYKWDSGYRIGAGYQFECSQWELDAFWTHFDGHGSRNSGKVASINNENDFHLKFNQIDVAFAYNTYLNSFVLFKPFLGVRGLIMEEKVTAGLVTKISPALTLPFATHIRAFDDHQKFSGIGALLGFEAEWKTQCGLGFYGLASTSLLYANNKLHFDDVSIVTEPYSRIHVSLNKRHVHSFNCGIDLALGISWQTCLCDTVQVVTRLGFEHHEYFNISQLGAHRGDLCLDGGVFSLELAY